MPERPPSRRATRARASKSLAFSAGEAGLLGACSGYSDTLLAGSVRDVLPEPVIDELDDLVAVPVEEHLVLVAVDADVLQADELVLRAGLIEPLRHARVEHDGH